MTTRSVEAEIRDHLEGCLVDPEGRDLDVEVAHLMSCLAPAMAAIRAEAWEAGAKAGHHSPLTWFALRQVNPYRAAALTEDPS